MSARTSRRNRKIAAIAAGALVVGVGATYTLATWNDSEWVWGGADGGGPGVGTKTFEVQQNTTSPFDNAAVNWLDRETNHGDPLKFTTAALSLTPGDTVYAPVSLHTKTGSLGATVTLQGAVKASGITTSDDTDALWDAVRISVYTSNAVAPEACSITEFDAGDWTPVPGLSSVALNTPATGTQSLPAATTTGPGDPQHYCFAITLPTGSSDALQGRTIAPAWEFSAVSNQ